MLSEKFVYIAINTYPKVEIAVNYCFMEMLAPILFSIIWTVQLVTYLPTLFGLTRTLKSKTPRNTFMPLQKRDI